MNRDTYLKFAKKFYADSLAIMVKKNHDYSKVDDPFSNFRIQAVCSGVPTERTFLVAMGIKVARLNELLDKNKKAQVDESLKDTLSDLVNYACLLAGYLESEK